MSSAHRFLEPKLIAIGAGDPPSRPAELIQQDKTAQVLTEMEEHVMNLDPDRLQAALLEYANTGIMTKACTASGISRGALRLRIRLDPDFAEMWNHAREVAADGLEAEARRRAVEGVDKPVYYQGEKIDTIKEYSDTLLVKLLGAHKPALFRERHSISTDIPEQPSAQVWSPSKEAPTVTDRAMKVVGILHELGLAVTIAPVDKQNPTVIDVTPIEE